LKNFLIKIKNISIFSLIFSNNNVYILYYNYNYTIIIIIIPLNLYQVTYWKNANISWFLFPAFELALFTSGAFCVCPFSLLASPPF